MTEFLTQFTFVPVIVLPSSTSSTLTEQSNSQEFLSECQDVHARMSAWSYAPVQGLEDNMKRYMKSLLMLGAVPAQYKPSLLRGLGNNEAFGNRNFNFLTVKIGIVSVRNKVRHGTLLVVRICPINRVCHRTLGSALRNSSHSRGETFAMKLTSQRSLSQAIQEVVAADVVAALEAAWVLTSIASGTAEQTEVVTLTMSPRFDVVAALRP